MNTREYIYRNENSLWFSLPLAEVRARVEINGLPFGKETLEAGALFIVPHEARIALQIMKSAPSFHAFIDYALIARVADQIYARPVDTLDLEVVMGVNDNVVRSLLKTLQHHLMQPDHASWCVDYLSRAIAAHVLSTYAKDRGYAQKPDSLAELSSAQMQRVEEFLQSNLEGNFKFEQLGASIGLSRTLFFERFKRSTNLSPNQYLQLLRVERAKQLLRDGRLPMAEIALISGFPDQAYMNRIFGRVTGTTPGRYRTDHQ